MRFLPQVRTYYNMVANLTFTFPSFLNKYDIFELLLEN